MTLLMARPGVGKTSMMADIAVGVCEWRDSKDGQEYQDKHCPGGVIRLILIEMTAENFQQRLTCKQAGVSLQKVREGGLDDEQFKRYEQASRWVAKLPIEYLDNTQGLDQTSIFLQAANEAPTLWWGVDYIQIHPTGQRGQQGDTSSINLISTTLRYLAKEVAPGLVLSQMTREVDKRQDRRPILSDLRGSGQLEADAAVILGIYREDLYNRVSDEERDNPRVSELGLIKQRNGPSNVTINMLWHPNQMQFEDITSLVHPR
jgi:replicative DNA helicase